MPSKARGAKAAAPVIYARAWDLCGNSFDDDEGEFIRDNTHGLYGKLVNPVF